MHVHSIIMIYRCRSDVDGTKTPAIEHLEQAGNQSPLHQFQDSPDQVQERPPPTKQHCLDHRDPSSPIAPSPEPLSPILKERVCGSSTYRCVFCFLPVYRSSYGRTSANFCVYIACDLYSIFITCGQTSAT